MGKINQNTSVKRNYFQLVIYLLLSLVIILKTVVIFGNLKRFITWLTVDDYFIYLKIARNWAALGYPSFDGITFTNGFQPLWGLFTTSFAYFIKDLHLLARLVCFVSLLIDVFVTYPIYKTGKLLGGERFANIAALSWCAYLLVFQNGVLGMEAPLHGLIFSFLILFFVKYISEKKAESIKHILILSVLLTLNALSRLDSGIISACLAVWIISHLFRRKCWTRLFVFLLVPVLSFSILFAVYGYFFSSLMPISGQAKFFWVDYVYNNFSTLDVFQQTIYFSRPILSTIIILAACFCLFYVIVKRKDKGAKVFLILACFVFVHMFYIHYSLKHFAVNDTWYHHPLRVILALLLGYISFLPAIITRKRTQACFVIYIFLLFFLLLSGYKEWQKGNTYHSSFLFYMDRIKAAKWMDKSPLINTDYNIASWNSGQLGFFTEKHRVINLDGFAQSKDFIRTVLHTQKWKDYFIKSRIRYLVDYNFTDSTFTYRKRWDRSKFFKGLIPWDCIKNLNSFGEGLHEIYVLDIQECLK